MKHLLVLFFLSVGLVGFTGNYSIVNLDITLKIDGKLITNPKVVTKFGEKVTIRQDSVDGADDTFLEVLSEQVSPKEVLVKLKVGKIINGKSYIISNPRIMTVLGEKAEMTTTRSPVEGSGQNIQVSVTPTM